ncbi:MAG: hypothetical protein FJX25_04110 [Alphaproteobacteria bacterium]|nr:hypothetical protein [Alphaproteobacteria bacterium]
MSARGVRYCFGTIILMAHFGAILLYGSIGFVRLPDIDDVAALILTITPLTALYFMAFMRYVVLDAPAADTSPGPSKASFLVQLSVIIIFCIFLLPIGGYVFWSGKIDNQNISVLTGLIETLFGAYLAVIFYTLFPEKKDTGTP